MHSNEPYSGFSFFSSLDKLQSVLSTPLLIKTQTQGRWCESLVNQQSDPRAEPNIVWFMWGLNPEQVRVF